jgi:hypothetical protein
LTIEKKTISPQAMNELDLLIKLKFSSLRHLFCGFPIFQKPVVHTTIDMYVFIPTSHVVFVQRFEVRGGCRVSPIYNMHISLGGDHGSSPIPKGQIEPTYNFILNGKICVMKRMYKL